jgi:hypothetical protein
MSKKNASLKKNDPAAAAAKKMHGEIVATASELMKKWTALARKCLDFKEAQHYKHVVNPTTKSPFTSFSTWVKFVFGTSKSTIFAATRILHELDGLVSDDDLAEMTKENAEALVEAKTAGEEITPELVATAKTEPAKDLRKKVASVRLIDEKKESGAETQKLGPFRVSKSTAKEFQRAFDVATDKTAAAEGDKTDRTLGYMARTFLAAVERTGEQEVAA